MKLSPRALGWLAAVSMLGATACSSTVEAPVAPNADLPKWEAELHDLYPDQIDPAVLGLMAPRPASRTDRTLWTRATTADVVGRAGVTTLDSSRRGRSGDLTYILTITFDDPPLARPRVDQKNFQLTIDPTNQSYGMINVLGDRIKERKFVAVVKRFAGRDDEIDVHFYLYPVSAGVEEVVQEAVAVEEVREQ
ncbi:MAG: hypothetical protein U0414_29165 [Polyangiaceae bacterium]